MDDKNLDQKKDLAVECFSKTLDKDLSYERAGFGPDDFDYLENDDELQARFRYYITRERADVIDKFKSFMNSKNEKVAFDATKEFARLLYPEYFVDPKFNTRFKKDKKKIGEYDLESLTDEDLINLAKQVKK